MAAEPRDDQLVFDTRVAWLAESWTTSRLEQPTYSVGAVWQGDALLALALATDEAEPETELIVLGVPFTSQDGEYRFTVLPRGRVDDFIRGLPHADSARLSDAVIGEDPEPVTVVAFARTPTRASALEEHIQDTLAGWLPVLPLYAWSAFGSDGGGVPPKHVHGPTADAYLDMAEDLGVFYPEGAPECKKSERDFLRLLTTARRDAFHKQQLEVEGTRAVSNVGAKLIPMTVGEITHPGSLGFRLWREIYADHLAASFTINGLSDAFPLVGQWATVLGSGPKLYAAHTHHERFERAPIVMQVRDQIAEGRARLCELGPAAEAACAAAGRAVGALDSRLSVTDVSMVKTVEHLGNTLAHAALRVGEGVPAPRDRLFSDPELYEPLVFGWIFAIHVLHTRGRIIHGDLHANNIVVNWRRVDRRWDTDCGDREEYELELPGAGDAAARYIFRHSCIRPHVIDFSRAIVADPGGLAARYGAEGAEEALAQQAPALAALVRRAAPEYAAGGGRAAAFEGAARMNFAGAFNAAAALDVVVLANALLHAADIAAAHGRVEGFRGLAAKLQRIAYTRFEERAEALLAGPLGEANAAPPDAAAMAIRELFAARRAAPGERGTMRSRWVAARPTPIDPADPATWGPLEPALGAKLLARIRKRARARGGSRAGMAMRELRAEAQSRRGHGTAPASTTGSWIV